MRLGMKDYPAPAMKTKDRHASFTSECRRGLASGQITRPDVQRRNIGSQYEKRERCRQPKRACGRRSYPRALKTVVGATQGRTQLPSLAFSSVAELPASHDPPYQGASGAEVPAEDRVRRSPQAGPSITAEQHQPPGRWLTLPGWSGSACDVVLARGEWPQNAAAPHGAEKERRGTPLVRST